MREQTLDSMDLEREKGITIKLKAVRMFYTPEKSETYELKLIDTPGHVDFSYEVSRSLAACEGTVLVVDATQGIEAQTLSNVYKAMEAGLTIIPVVNKIDLPSSEPEKVAKDLVSTLGFKKEDIVFVSAKTGQNTENLLREIIKRVPPPSGKEDGPFRALIFDSFFDEYLGVVALVRVVDGKISQEDTLKKEKIRFLATGVGSFPEEIGFFSPQRKKASILSAGEVGYIATGLKEIKKVRVGDTVVLDRDIPLKTETTSEALPGYKEVKPFVFLSLYPTENDKFPALREALLKLSLSDSSLSFEPESSSALGFGFRCGFLGLLHDDVIQERLEREYNLELISSTPSVEYQISLTDGTETSIKTASEYPDRTRIAEVREPWILLHIVTPAEYIGGVLTLCEERRGIQKKVEYPSQDRVVLEFELHLIELVFNFFDELKSVSSGFASLDYDFLEYRPVDVVKLDVLVHGDVVEPLSRLVLKQTAEEEGREILKKLKDVIPKQQFKVSLQAAIGGKIVAREDISSMGKNVLAKMSGGHRERT